MPPTITFSPNITKDGNATVNTEKVQTLITSSFKFQILTEMNGLMQNKTTILSKKKHELKIEYLFDELFKAPLTHVSGTREFNPKKKNISWFP